MRPSDTGWPRAKDEQCLVPWTSACVPRGGGGEERLLTSVPINAGDSTESTLPRSEGGKVPSEVARKVTLRFLFFIFFFLQGGTHWCAQGLLPALCSGIKVLGTTLGLPRCKAGTRPAALSLQPPLLIFSFLVPSGSFVLCLSILILVGLRLER